ncbi:MAG: MraY family glycosyltransferase [Candidatus Cloacimonadota bacterium]|nr:MraY family glycosyltransferase [Candidatus Cloacimonadota bacterium]
MLIVIISAVFIFSIISTYFLIPLNIKISKTFALIDKPKDRSIHKEIVPSSGGISFIISILSIYCFISFFDYFAHSALYRTIIIGGLAIGIIGILDDKHSLPANSKLILQLIIAIFMTTNGFIINILTNPFGGEIVLGWISYPLTIIWYLVVLNAFNLIDGIDGLAAGISATVSFILLIVSVRYTNQFVFFITLPLLGAMIAFLKFNFYPAKIFMGDAGSLFIGFLIASVSIAGNYQFKGITAITLLIPLVALSFPLADISWAVFRRIKNRTHIFEADKEHIHHKLLDRGFSQKTVALTGYFITLLFGLIAIGFSYSSKKIVLITLILLFSLMIIVFYKIFFGGKKK